MPWVLREHDGGISVSGTSQDINPHNGLLSQALSIMKKTWHGISICVLFAVGLPLFEYHKLLGHKDYSLIYYISQSTQNSIYVQ